MGPIANRLSLLFVASIALGGCASRDARPERVRARVALVAPAGSPELERRGLVFRRGLAVRGLDLAPASEVALALSTSEDGCRSEVSCLVSLGRAVHADRVVVLDVEQLGSTVVVRTRNVATRDGADRTVTRSHRLAQPSAIDAALRTDADELARTIDPPVPVDDGPSPWLFVVGAAVVVVGASVAVGVALSSDGSDDPDVVITPP